MYSRTFHLTISCGRVRGRERIVKSAASGLAMLSFHEVVIYVFLQDSRGGEEDPDRKALQTSQRSKKPSIERLNDTTVNAFHDSKHGLPPTAKFPAVSHGGSKPTGECTTQVPNSSKQAQQQSVLSRSTTLSSNSFRFMHRSAISLKSSCVICGKNVILSETRDFGR